MFTREFQTMKEIPYLAVSGGNEGAFALVQEGNSIMICLQHMNVKQIREELFYMLAAYPNHIPVVVYDSFSADAAQKLTDVIYAVEGVAI